MAAIHWLSSKLYKLQVEISFYNKISKIYKDTRNLKIVFTAHHVLPCLFVYSHQRSSLCGWRTHKSSMLGLEESSLRRVRSSSKESSMSTKRKRSSCPKHGYLMPQNRDSQHEKSKSQSQAHNSKNSRGDFGYGYGSLKMTNSTFSYMTWQMTLEP